MWKSSDIEKQEPTSCSRSSAEAEFRALSNGICEDTWLKMLLNELEMGDRHSIEINRATLMNVKNHVHHERTKHVDIDIHFISEKIEKKVVDLHYVPSHVQLADILTKVLRRPHFEELKTKFGMTNIYPQSWGGVLEILD